ncbi:unnamed protein product (macronuclear) [Paramecium tetraurelia]|uniref:RING-type domain-containing protein n=1 Tax=Paramecium tetraurelia TaxID=5888 RepID=A0DX67_PARTE|nr:uncharacterized protein GSPATT00021266001 [Paramecium tetraurelia]CAK87634.1 unnamed protein product [Paramecium tetraurelia]|eukprot:XP_001455031.1 hypothetical protein (macronuclear) [Paramecium tetraurelia strain d4-2]
MQFIKNLLGQCQGGNDSKQGDPIEKQNNQKHNKRNEENYNDQANSESDAKSDVKTSGSKKNSRSSSAEKQTQQQQNYNQNQSQDQGQVLKIESDKQFIQKSTESQNLPSQSLQHISKIVMEDYQKEQNKDNYINQIYSYNQTNEQLKQNLNQANQNLCNSQNQDTQSLHNSQNQAYQNLNYYRNQTQSQIRCQNSPKRSIPYNQRMDPNQNIYAQQINDQQFNQQNFQGPSLNTIYFPQFENKKIKILHNANQNANQNIYQPPTYQMQEFENVNNYYKINNNKNESQLQSQVRQSNQSSNNQNSNIQNSNFYNCQENLSYAQTQLVKCFYCSKDVHKQYIQLNCQHFFCSDCLKEFLKNQSKQPNCYAYKCLCSCVIKLQVLFKEKEKDGEVTMLKEKLINNQLNALRKNIEQKYKLKTCCNIQRCSFFVILQQNLDQKCFYCPQCLERQRD